MTWPTVLILLFFLASIAVTVGTDWHPIIGLVMVWGSLIAIVVMLMQSYRRAKDNIPHL